MEKLRTPLACEECKTNNYNVEIDMQEDRPIEFVLTCSNCGREERIKKDIYSSNEE